MNAKDYQLDTPTPEKYRCATFGCDKRAVRVMVRFSDYQGGAGPFFYGECAEHPTEVSVAKPKTKPMSEFERKAFADLRDVQDRILEVMYGETNVLRAKRLHKWAAQTDRLLTQESRYVQRREAARRKIA